MICKRKCVNYCTEDEKKKNNKKYGFVMMETVWTWTHSTANLFNFPTKFSNFQFKHKRPMVLSMSPATVCARVR